MTRAEQTDLGNADRLVSRHGLTIRYDRDAGAWLSWNGSVWTYGAAPVMEFAKATARSLLAEVGAQPDIDAARSLASWAVTSMSQPRLAAMVRLAATDPRIAVRGAALDPDPHLLNTPSGIVDLRTGRISPSDPIRLMSRVTSVPYEPDAPCPIWEAALLRAMAGDRERVDYLQRSLGYALTGEVAEQAFFLWIGVGASAKSTTLTTVGRVLGTYSKVAQASVFVASSQRRTGPEPELHRLLGARFVSTSELDGDARIDEARLKSLTGNEPIATRTLWREVTEQVPAFKLFVAANHLPRIAESGDAIWRRIRLVEWNEQIPKAERDPYFERRLVPEHPGILAWLVRGALAYYRDGLGEPATVAERTTEYRASQDLVGRFLSEETVRDTTVQTSASELHAAYARWCQRAGEPVLSARRLGPDLVARGYLKTRAANGRQCYGLRLRAA